MCRLYFCYTKIFFKCAYYYILWISYNYFFNELTMAESAISKFVIGKGPLVVVSTVTVDV